MKNLFLIFSIIPALLLNGCGPKKINTVVDTLYIQDQAKYEKDKNHCMQIALTYDLTDEKVMKAFYGGAVGSGLATGAAMALAAGAINPVAIPLIIAAGALGAAGGAMSTEERVARENIMYQCLEKHGYVAYSPHKTN